MLGKIEGRRRGRQWMRWLDGITDAMDMNLGKLGDGEGQGGLVCCSPWGRKESDTTGQLNNNNKNIDSIDNVKIKPVLCLSPLKSSEPSLFTLRCPISFSFILLLSSPPLLPPPPFKLCSSFPIDIHPSSNTVLTITDSWQTVL